LDRTCWGLIGKTKKTKRQEQKEVITKSSMMMELLGELGMDLDELTLGDVEDYVDDVPDDTISAGLRLGIQSIPERQREIDCFQSGKSQYCMFTFGAGGAGLSLHHSEPKLKPRRGYHAASYNEMETEQAFGRGHRINSLSDTEQSILVFRNTIEQKVLGRMFQKKNCLDVVMRHTDESVYHDREADDILAITAEGEEETIREEEIEEMINSKD